MICENCLILFGFFCVDRVVCVVFLSWSVVSYIRGIRACLATRVYLSVLVLVSLSARLLLLASRGIAPKGVVEGFYNFPRSGRLLPPPFSPWRHRLPPGLWVFHFIVSDSFTLPSWCDCSFFLHCFGVRCRFGQFRFVLFAVCGSSGFLFCRVRCLFRWTVVWPVVGAAAASAGHCQQDESVFVPENCINEMSDCLFSIIGGRRPQSGPSCAEPFQTGLVVIFASPSSCRNFGLCSHLRFRGGLMSQPYTT